MNGNFTRTVYCSNQEWFHSPDDRLENSSILTSSSNSFQINVMNGSGSDEGVYGCIADSGQLIVKQCIYLYSKCPPFKKLDNAVYLLTQCLSYIGRLALASCPHNSEVCVENVTASDGTASLNATLHYIPGGSCGFRHRITNVILKNLTSRKNIFSSRTQHGADKVNLTRGESGLEIVLTLMNVDSVHKSGPYEVIIEGNDPSTGSYIKLVKTFHISIQRKF